MHIIAVNTNMTVSEIVQKHYRTADVFKKLGINYCCGGNGSLRDACALKGIDLDNVCTELEQAMQTVQLPGGVQFEEWPVDFLIDYVIHVHHSYLKKVLRPLSSSLKSFSQGHQNKYPYIMKVTDSFESLVDELEEHIQKEEAAIFPYLKQMHSAHSRKEPYGNLFVRTLSKPYHKTIELEHKRIAAYLKELRELTNDYHFTPSVCTNHQVLYHKLKELDADLVVHMRLENNVLFPKAMQMEKELLQV